MINTTYDIAKNLLIKTPVDIIPEPVSFHVNSFDQKTVEGLAQAISKSLNTGQEVLPVFINSFGGAVYHCLAMRDLIKTSPIPVSTIAIGTAMSAGQILLTAGHPKLRISYPNTRIMFHGVWGWAIGKTEELKVDLKNQEYLEDLVFGFLDEDCKQKNGYFKKLFKECLTNDLYLSPEAALSHGMIDVIGVPNFKIKVKYNCEFSITK